MSDCPKCGTALRQVTVVSRASGLERASESGFVEGLTCWKCGKWIDAEVRTVRPMPPRFDNSNGYFPKGMTITERGDQLHAKVKEHMPEIERLFRDGFNFKGIVKALQLPLCTTTLYKYWKIEKGL
ncbi:MAG: hypothetical protein HGB32_15365 [Geobacteraceae bacterium]|nr:hypothetical protein [Geobacteraceae bacterium]NTW81502.1 hypothetical protein [Geobacteraceae bacterium]